MQRRHIMYDVSLSAHLVRARVEGAVVKVCLELRVQVDPSPPEYPSQRKSTYIKKNIARNSFHIFRL
jgi:hypothetical protein